MLRKIKGGRQHSKAFFFFISGLAAPLFFTQTRVSFQMSKELQPSPVNLLLICMIQYEREIFVGCNLLGSL